MKVIECHVYVLLPLWQTFLLTTFVLFSFFCKKNLLFNLQLIHLLFIEMKNSQPICSYRNVDRRNPRTFILKLDSLYSCQQAWGGENKGVTRGRHPPPSGLESNYPNKICPQACVLPLKNATVHFLTFIKVNISIAPLQTSKLHPLTKMLLTPLGGKRVCYKMWPKNPCSKKYYYKFVQR